MVMPVRQADFARWPHGAAQLQALTTANITNADLNQLVSVCNQPLVYDRLFSRRLKKALYLLANAQSFVDFGDRGWRDGTHFVYVIRDDRKQIVGAIDIKSAEQVAEIGYWADEEHRGYVTNAVHKIVEIARAAGYKTLFALIAPENNQSQAVIKRAGFTEVSEFEKDGRKLIKFELPL